MMKKVCLALIRLYQVGISPYLGHHCRFIPTCSEYTYHAIVKYGPLKRTYMRIRRIL